MIIGIDASRATVAEKTGTEWYSFHVIQQMVSRHPETTFWLYTKKPLPPPLSMLVRGNTENRVLGWPGALWSQLRLSYEMLRRPPDVLFVPAHTLPFIHPRRTVTTCHDVGFERFPELYGRQPIGSRRSSVKFVFSLIIRLLTLGRYGNTELDYHRFSMRLAVRVATKIIAISHFTKREILRFYQVPDSKLVVIHQGFNPNPAPRPSGAEMRRRYHLPKPYLLFIGRLERKKNVAGLVTAYAQLQSQLPDPPDLLLVGRPGVGFEEIESAIKQLRNPQAVHRLPWLPSSELTALLAGADVFVFPSFYEGFGLPVLEAFAEGIPVVASSAGSLPEVAGEAALLVSPNDTAGLARAIRLVLADASLRKQLVDKGRARCQLFRWEKTAEATYRLLQSIGSGVA